MCLKHLILQFFVKGLITMEKQLITLIIMDGFGVSENTRGNAIKAAATPNLDKLFYNFPNTSIDASGMAVGLPDGQMGNSEVGHTNMGAGRIVYQELTRISKSIAEGEIFGNEELIKACDNCKKNDSSLHLIGLLSDGGVHSHIKHLFGLLEMAKKQGLEKVFVHAILDGRDVSPVSGAGFIKELEAKMEEIGIGKIATVMGRYYAMDRDNRWERVSKAYDAMVCGKGERALSAAEYVRASYEKDVTDEFVIPAVCCDDKIKENDSIVFFNFRPDRAREITRTFVDPEFSGFDRKYFPVHYVCMTQYDATMPNVSVAYKPQSLENTFGEYLSRLGKKQLRIAETEKYAHVTFFFNGGVEKVYDGEDRVLISSPKVSTYDKKPEMSAFEVTDAVLERINSGKYDNIILNYANCDMVGHTGFFDHAVKAVETVDTCVGKVVDAVIGMGGIAIITADHGNADKMFEDNGDDPFTAHTINKVPFILVGKDCELREGGTLADIAPTILHLMNIKKPAEMTGESLIK